jgi:hypothetical protein
LSYGFFEVRPLADRSLSPVPTFRLPEAIANARRSSLSIVQLAEPEICWELVVAHAVQGKAQNDVLDDAPKAFLDLLMVQSEWAASSAAEKIFTPTGLLPVRGHRDWCFMKPEVAYAAKTIWA